jgi:hypothetical protein
MPQPQKKHATRTWKISKGSAEKIFSYSFLMAAIAIIIMLATGFLADVVVQDRILPLGDKRVHEVNKVWVATAEQLCPGQGDVGSDLTACLGKLSLDNQKRPKVMLEMTTGPYEDYRAGKIPGYKAQLAQLAKTNSAYLPLVDAIGQRKTVVMGLQIPTRFFSPPGRSSDGFGLSFYGARSVRIYFDGITGGMADDQQPQTIIQPLESSKTTNWDPSLPQTVWITYADAVGVKIGLSLQHGLYVAAMSDLHRVMRGIETEATDVYLFLGFFILGIAITMIMELAVRPFPDMGALALAATIIGVALIYERLCVKVVPGSRQDYLVMLIYVSRLSIAVAITSFAVSRWRDRHRWTMLSVPFMLLPILYLIIYALWFVPQISGFGSITTRRSWFHEHSEFLWQLNGLIAAGVGGFFLLYLSLRHHQLAIKSSDEITKMTHRLRSREEFSLALAMIALGGSVAWFRGRISYENLSYNMSIGLAVTAWVLISRQILFVTAQARQKNLQTSARSGHVHETKAMEIIHGQNAARAMRQQRRTSVLIAVDLANSSATTRRLQSGMHRVMKTVQIMLFHDIKAGGFKILHHKTVGDCHFVLLNVKGETPASDLEDATALMTRALPKLRQMMRYFDPEDQALDLHASLFVISDHSLEMKSHSPEEDESWRAEISRLLGVGSWETPDSDDFFAVDANYLLKYAPNAANGALMVAARREHISLGLWQKMTHHRSMADDLAAKLAGVSEPEQQTKLKAAKDVVTELNLVYGEIETSKISGLVAPSSSAKTASNLDFGTSKTPLKIKRAQ